MSRARPLLFAVALLLVVLGTTALPMLTFGVGPGAPSPAPALVAVVGIPPRALAAYQAADGWCPGLRWQLLAALGRVESGHGSSGGATVGPDTGAVAPPIFGPPLDGSGETRRLPLGRWAGRWGLAGEWQRAVGPMQFLAPTFGAWGVDADGDGAADPHDLDDAAATAANYLCDGWTGRIGDERAALARYNAGGAYADELLEYAAQLSEGPLRTGGAWLCPVAGPTAFTDSWGAPRSGGRHHQGVDMFAARGTPVVAPVAGRVEHFDDGLGGLSFRLWGDDGSYYYGTHLSAYGPATGSVGAGTVVGYVGDTGNAAGTGPHLHFEIHPGRRPGGPPTVVNPTSTVAAACGPNRLGPGLTGRS